MKYVRELTYSRSSLTHKGAAALLRALGTPYALSQCASLCAGDYRAIVDSEMPLPPFGDVETFRRDYLAYNLLRKYDRYPLGIDTAQAAYDKFFESEVACKETNRTRVMPYRPATCGLSPESYISYARNIIEHLLGAFSWNAAAERFAFSGGASTRLQRRSGAPFYKFQGKPDTTRNNGLLAICAIQSIPLWKSQMISAYGEDPCNWVNIVEGSRITTVSKTAKIDRCIAIEPCMNMFIQKGIGSLLRSKLRSVGIDLNDQTLNQKLAKIGSSTGSLATIDLASASDSISLSLVELLLPSDWFEALCLCRSEWGIFPNGVKHRFEKISSMGNGYTFELESLIFWALSKAVIALSGVADRRLGIYGDDIVIHNSCAEVLIELLDYCGFKTNVEKTFLSGPFRESCGKHYYLGDDVTPFYIKTPLDSLSEHFWFINSIRLWSSTGPVDDAIQECYDYVYSKLEPKHRYHIPMSYGPDAGVWASFDECAPRYIPWRMAYSVKLLVGRRRKHRPDGSPALLHYFNGRGDFQTTVLSLIEGDRGPSQVQLEKGETRYSHSRVYLSWWDTAPCGVILGNSTKA